MANKITIALTEEQYCEIIRTMQTGGSYFRANKRIATALVLEANLGMRIQDILNLCLSDIITDGYRYRLNVHEQKTGKARTFTVPKEIYEYIDEYRIEMGIGCEEPLFNMTERNVEKYLGKVADYLGYDNIGTHSFRKYFATQIYVNSNYNIVLVQQLLQHSSPQITMRYIGISSLEMEDALHNHIKLPGLSENF